MIEPMDLTTLAGLQHVANTRCLRETREGTHRCYLMRDHDDMHECTCGKHWRNRTRQRAESASTRGRE